MSEETEVTTLKTKLVTFLGRWSLWMDPFAILVQDTEANLVGPVSPAESPMLRRDLGLQHVRVGVKAWPQSAEFGIGDAELTVVGSLVSERAAFIVLSEKKDGLVAFYWESGHDGVLRIHSPHLESVADTLESELVRMATPRRGPRAAG